jgi:ribosomal protein S18 acetylase RimI-like enzyme
MVTVRVTVRPLAPGERGMLAPLLEELLRHDAMPAPDQARIGQVLAEQPPGVEMLVAEGPEGPLGFASFAHIFPGLGTAPQLYMKEIYVAHAARSRGIGEALLRALAQIATERGCTRIDWTTQDTNDGARAFYERIGARVLTEKVYFRLDEAAIAALITRR